MRRTWAAALIGMLGAAATAAAQQGSVQISSATQIVAADPDRRAGQTAIEPDFGLTVNRPGVRFGSLFIDLHAVQRGNRPELGAASVAVREFKLGGLTWSLTGGDTSASPVLSTFAFTNLFAPQVTFAGGNLSGFSPRGSLSLTAGRVTALRNIFGSDPQGLGQDMAQFEARLRPVNRVELLAHASQVRTRDTHEFTAFVDRGADVGGGLRVRPIPTMELTVDGGLSRFQRRGVSTREQSVTALVGGKWTLGRGWLEVNAQRFAPGYFAVVNTPFLDREGAFAAGQFDVAPALRVFGGVDAFRTNLDTSRSALASSALPRGLSERAFAGMRLHVGGRSFVTLRAEQGDRTAKPVGRRGGLYDSDTGVTTVEFQSSVRRLSTFARYERRENVDRANGLASYTQQTASAQLFGTVTPRVQIFGSATAVQQARAEGGQTFWQGGGGLQVQLPHRDLWLRGEGLFSRTDEWGADLSLPHELYTAGLSGQLTARTMIAFDLMLDRAPQPSGSDAGPWLGRSMIRLVHTMPTGTARVQSGARVTARQRGGGSIVGLAFADWNGDGVQNAGEEPLDGVPFLYSAGVGATSNAASGVRVNSGRDGQFAFLNVPEGRARVSLDLGSLPVDFDPPEQTWADTEARGTAGARFAFGLVPLGTVAGAVLRDVNNDGRRNTADTPVDGAVLVLDNGARSEQTREGAFRFEAVRPGPHSLKLLNESLPEGMSLIGEAQVAIVVDRTQMHPETTFLVRVEQRPEIRKVFPAKGAPGSTRSASLAPSVPPPRKGTRSRGVVAARSARATGASLPFMKAPTWYAIQLAATSDRARAWELVKALQSAGIDAYLSEDADGLAKVRVGSYRTRAEAERQLPAIRARAAESFIARIGTE